MPFALRSSGLLLPVGLFVSVAVLILAFWAWIGRPVEMPASPLGADGKLPCVSYAPFREGQSPLGDRVPIAESQIEEDMAQLAKLTQCVRTYSVELGLDKVAPLARKYGIKVLQGVWLGSNPEKNRAEIDAAVAVAQKYPDVISAMVVGNEVMLRGELSAAAIAAALRDVKARVGGIPVTYADVWEFWERAPALAGEVDFVTVHILPYWEDFPVPAEAAAAHIDRIRQHVAAQFPGKEILIGETGWPSAGRMREGALPAPSTQARVLSDVLRLAAEKGYRVNLIEAYDQPWKRRNEGTVGGHWGLIEAVSRAPKFAWGTPVSDHPYWPLQALTGIVLAGVAFAVAGAAARRLKERGEAPPKSGAWVCVSVLALTAGATLGGTITALPLESLGGVGWARNGAFLGLSLAVALVVPALLVRRTPLASVAVALDVRGWRLRPARIVAGSVLLVLGVLAVGEVALELIFDPRYKDFPLYPLTPVVVALGLLAVRTPPQADKAGFAERSAFCLLLVAAFYIPLNETLANWQALWFGLICLCLALTLLRVLAARAKG
ncbi:beta-1,6-glucan synthase [Aquabacter spiritensis]|uniref:Endo-1,3-beta-glucanase btgC n=1 Tax=Aquabacter spiritensis TaxID=933073 RepID=A0A4R3LQV3_9HYPH|nr:beta-1,6-glucan synthase [Aquabacter spiritensis]TCT02883.1 glucan 1,3-beta-glucosidase [Aquabacter spiritensis]